MAGKPKRSIDFAGWRVDIFENDTKIDELIDGQGWIGFSVYFYLCQKAYASDGYFYRWSYANAATTARRMGGGIRSETVKQVVALCLRIGLFDKRLFDREGVLTSRGIQRRYMVAIEKRSFKEVERKLWLLNEDESKGVVVPEDGYSLPEDGYSLPENNTKESKEKKSKVNESKAEDSPDKPAQFPLVNQVFELFNQICNSYPKITSYSDARKKAVKARLNSGYTVDDFQRLFSKAEKSDFLKGKNNRNWIANFDWLIKDSNMAKTLDGNYDNKDPISKSQEEHSYDLDDYKSLVNRF